MSRHPLLCAFLACVAFAASAAAFAAEAASARPVRYIEREDVREFIEEMTRHGLDASYVERSLASARYQPKVVELMSRPIIEPPKWFEYSRPFLSNARVEAGIAFWNANAPALQRAEAETGVPAEIIVAILGIETYYGRHAGSHRVIDALATLAFDYPRRAAYFRGELREFLLLARDEGLSPLTVKGSFAGAMGLPQFMPGSYRRYAVDFDGSGSIDLFASVEDAIGSVANYLARHDWQPMQPALVPARVTPAAFDLVLRSIEGGLSARRVIAMWEAEGVSAAVWPGTLGPEPVGLLILEESPTESSYWIAGHNFYVIMRYNRSRLYASAVWQLAQALRTGRLRY